MQLLFIDGYPHNWCTMCTIYRNHFGLVAPIQISLKRKNTPNNNLDFDSEFEKRFDHQCKHLCYYRYVCTYCLQKYQQSTSQRKRNSNFNETNDLLMKTYRKCQLLDDINDYGQMFLSFISATTVRNHIEQKHTTAEFKNVTFKRWMSVDSLEYQLRKCYSHFGWNFDGELDSYEHEDIRRILQTHMVIKKKKKPFIKIMSENKSEWIRNLYKHYTECPLPKMPTISMNDLEEVLYFVNNLIHDLYTIYDDHPL